MDKKVDNLKEEIKYAIKLHLDDFKFRTKEHQKTLKEKNYILKLLFVQKIKKGEYKKAEKILKKWQDNHFFWINLVKENKLWQKEGGSISWHKRWIKTYQKIMDYLSSFDKI